MSNCVTGVLTNAIPIYPNMDNPHVFSNFEASNTKSLTINVPVLITDVSLLWQSAPSAHYYQFSFDASDHIVANVAGHYGIVGDLTFRSVNGGGEYRINVMKNDIAIASKRQEAQASGFLFTIPVTTGAELEIGDKIHFEFVNTSNSNDIQLLGGSLFIHLVHLI